VQFAESWHRFEFITDGSGRSEPLRKWLTATSATFQRPRISYLLPLPTPPQDSARFTCKTDMPSTPSIARPPPLSPPTPTPCSPHRAPCRTGRAFCARPRPPARRRRRRRARGQGRGRDRHRRRPRRRGTAGPVAVDDVCSITVRVSLRCCTHHPT
jgi:hypothetical protein